MTLQELQALVAQAVEARGYREGWTNEQYAARQVCKAVEELSELQTGVSWFMRLLPSVTGLRLTGLYARQDFDQPDGWDEVVGVDMEIIAKELPDVIIPLLVLANTLGIDLEQEIRAKALGDVERGVRGEALEAQEPEWVLLGSLLSGTSFKTEHGERGTIVDGPKWIGPVKTLGESGRIVEMTPDRWVRVVVAQKQGRWVTLESLRAGAIFETQDGERAVKRAHTIQHGWTQCILLEDGGEVHFNNAEPLLVREIVL